MEARTGIDSAYIGAMERGVQNITMDSLSNLAAAYGVQPHDLICGIGYGVSPSQLVTLDVLARLTSAVDNRIQTLLLEQGARCPSDRTLWRAFWERCSKLWDAESRMEPTTRIGDCIAPPAHGAANVKNPASFAFVSKTSQILSKVAVAL